MNNISKVAKWSYLLLLLPGTLLFCAWQSSQWWYWATSPVANETLTTNFDRQIQIHIPLGTSTRQIGKDLEATGVIHSSLAWNLWALHLSLTQMGKTREEKGTFKAGIYAISPSEDLKTIAQKIWQGDVTAPSFTIPEGWSRSQMGDYFESKGYFSKQAFMKASAEIPNTERQWLPKNIPHLEGFLYPDTYQLQKPTLTPENVVSMMLDRFEAVVLPLYESQKDETELSFYDWLKLASLVEKETVKEEERALIAGVFINRLKRNMKLEADPTVEYALGIKQTPEKPLTLTQISTNSPYNTYLNFGLTPTPISNPSLASLEATLKPEETDYYFFVARYDGTHIFSKTLEEHEIAIREIREKQNTNQQAP